MQRRWRSDKRLFSVFFVSTFLFVQFKTENLGSKGSMLAVAFRYKCIDHGGTFL
ncbi:hypothetical protein D931_02706 [Enterococcus faecium 13.SD.W.09]|nr:hypothetical protein D931_02706 [Enterococcus faecium 13.SD.W.09]